MTELERRIFPLWIRRLEDVIKDPTKIKNKDRYRQLTALVGALDAEKDQGILVLVDFGIFIGPADAKRRFNGSDGLLSNNDF